MDLCWMCAGIDSECCEVCSGAGTQADQSKQREAQLKLDFEQKQKQQQKLQQAEQELRRKQDEERRAWERRQESIVQQSNGYSNVGQSYEQSKNYLRNAGHGYPDGSADAQRPSNGRLEADSGRRHRYQIGSHSATASNGGHTSNGKVSSATADGRVVTDSRSLDNQRGGVINGYSEKGRAPADSSNGTVKDGAADAGSKKEVGSSSGNGRAGAEVGSSSGSARSKGPKVFSKLAGKIEVAEPSAAKEEPPAEASVPTSGARNRKADRLDAHMAALDQLMDEARTKDRRAEVEAHHRSREFAATVTQAKTEEQKRLSEQRQLQEQFMQRMQQQETQRLEQEQKSQEKLQQQYFQQMQQQQQQQQQSQINPSPHSPAAPKGPLAGGASATTTLLHLHLQEHKTSLASAERPKPAAASKPTTGSGSTSGTSASAERPKPAAASKPTTGSGSTSGTSAASASKAKDTAEPCQSLEALLASLDRQPEADEDDPSLPTFHQLGNPSGSSGVAQRRAANDPLSDIIRLTTDLDPERLKPDASIQPQAEIQVVSRPAKWRNAQNSASRFGQNPFRRK